MTCSSCNYDVPAAQLERVTLVGLQGAPEDAVLCERCIVATEAEGLYAVTERQPYHVAALPGQQGLFGGVA